MLLNISTQPVNIIFSPLYWLLDDTKSKDERPTPESFKNSYQRRCDQNRTPAGLENILLVQILGGLAIVGGVVSWFFGRSKESNVLKSIGAALGLGGIGAFVTGIFKGFGFDIKNPAQDLNQNANTTSLEPSINNGSPNSQESVVSPNIEVVSTIPQDRSLVVIAPASDSSNGVSIQEKQDTKTPNNLPSQPGYLEQAKRLITDIAKYCTGKASDYQHLLYDPRFQVLTIALGGKWIFIGAEVLKVYLAYLNGKLNYETEEGVKVSDLGENDKVKEYCKVLDLGLNPTEEEIKKAYRDKAKKYHPDRNPGDETAAKKFCAVQEAYEFLTEWCKKKV